MARSALAVFSYSQPQYGRVTKYNFFIAIFPTLPYNPPDKMSTKDKFITFTYSNRHSNIFTILGGVKPGKL